MGVSVQSPAIVGPGDLAPVASFESLYLEHRDAAVRLAAFLSDTAQAEDIAADVFARTYLAWRRGDLRDPRAYIRRSVLNEVLSRNRREQRQKRRWTTEGAHIEAGQDALADRTASRLTLLDALSALPMYQRAPIVLRYFEDLSETETARLLGVTTGTVKSSVSRGLDRLRALLAQGWLE